jgi:hypothetical protein
MPQSDKISMPNQGRYICYLGSSVAFIEVYDRFGGIVHTQAERLTRKTPEIANLAARCCVSINTHRNN